MASQAEQWFKLADQDGDGAVGGAEAVRFFTKSGLPQEVLGQIWEYASRGGASLNPMQFNVALRLVALAQSSGGRLVPDDQARVVVMGGGGGGPQLPPPRLAGLTEVPPTPSIATYTPQITGLTPQVTGAGAAGPYPPQITGGMPGPTLAPPYAAQVTGARPPYPVAPGPMQAGGYTPQATGGPYMTPAAAAAAATAGPTGGASGPTPLPGPPLGSGPRSSGPPSGGMMPLAAMGSIGPLQPPAAAGVTGGLAAAGVTGGLAAGAAAGPTGGLVYPPGFTPPSAADMQRYATAFVATDSDRDGVVKGSECFPLFMQSGLDKVVLKRMWDMVAGNAGQLNRDQFMRCMFLMDGLRRGLPLPAVLPPGPWPQVAAAVGPPPPQQAAAAAAAAPGGFQPGLAAAASGPLLPTPSTSYTGATGPQAAAAAAAARMSSGGGSTGATAGFGGPGVMMSGVGVMSGGGVGGAPPPLRAESWSLSSQFGGKGAVKAINEAYDQTLPKIPDPPGKVKYEGQAVPDSGPSAVPDLEATVASMLAPADKARWEAERGAALKKEQQQREADAEVANQKARLAMFQEALSELVMYKSKIDVALLQAGDSAARLTSEAEDLEVRYNRAQLAAQSQAEAGSKVRKQLQDLLAKKQEAHNKLQLLHQELEMAQNLNPEELVALEREVGLLMSQAAAAEAKKAALDMQLDSGRKQKGLLGDRINELDMAAAAGEGELRRAREELEQLKGKVLSAEASSLSADELGQVKPLLGKAASAYRRLYSTACAAGVEVPYEANLNNVGALVWLEQLMAGTADWVDDDTALSGYSVVNALPDLEGVPPALMRAAALAAAAQPPIKPSVILGDQPPAATAAGAAATAATAASDSKGDKAPAAATAAGAEALPAAAAAPEAVSAVTKAVSAAPTTAEPVKEAADRVAAPAATAKSAAAAASDKDSSKAGITKTAAAATAVAAAAAAGVGIAEIAAAKQSKDAVAAESAATAADDANVAGETGVAAASAAAATPAHADKADAAVLVGSDGTSAAIPTAQQVQEGAVAAETEHAAASAATADLPASLEAGAPDGAAVAAAAAPKSLLDDSDSEAGDEEGAAAAATAAAAPAAAMTPTVFSGLAGFDPSMYRLPDHERQLTQQHSIDSSYAGSFTERRRSSLDSSVAAGASGAFAEEPPAFAADSGGASGAQGGTSSTGGGGAAGQSSAAGFGFEDNAF